jgi:hypothetical protein
MADQVIPPDDQTPDQGPSSTDKETTNAKNLLDLAERFKQTRGENVEQEKAWNKLFAERASLLDDIIQKEIGFSAEQRAQARVMKEVLTDEHKLFIDAEKYFGVKKGETAELEKQLRLHAAITAAADAAGIKDEQRLKRMHEWAQRDLEASAKTGMINKAAGYAGAAGNIGDAVINYRLQDAMIAAIGKSATLIQGGNYTGRLGGQALSNQMFGGTGTATSPVERMEALNKVLMSAPKAANESSASMNKMIGTMAFFGADMTKITETLIKGSREAALGAEDIGRVYNFSNISAKDLGLSTQETADTLIDMSTVFRKVGGGVMQASGVMKSFSQDVEALGVHLLGVEKVELMTKFAQGISSLPFDKMVGLTAFATGKSVPSISEKDIGEGGMLGVAIKTFQKISSQTGGGFVNQGAATQKTAEMLGMQLSGLQTVALEKILKEGITASNKEDFDRLMDPSKHMAQGLDQLANTIGPIQRTANATESMQAMMSTMLAWGASITGVIPAIAALKWGAGVVSAAGGAAAVAEGVSEGAGLAAAGEGILGATVLGVSAPVLIGGAAIAGIGAAGYEAYKHRKDFGLTR